MRGKKGVKNVRKMPSERITTPGQKILNLFTEIGHPCPVVPRSWRFKQDEYWEMMRQKVEKGLELIKILNAALDEIEERDPEFASKFPWATTRKIWKEQGGVIDEDHLRIELLAHYQKNYSMIINKSSFYRSPSRDAYDKEQCRVLMNKLHARRRAEKAEREKGSKEPPEDAGD